MNRLSSSAGIAIGPILFVIAMLGILAMVFASDTGGSFGSAGVSDRVTTDILGQANLIRSKINECQMQYLVNGTNYATSGDCAGDPYPCSDQTNGSPVSALRCPNDPLVGGNQQSLWMGGARPASYPPPTKGFNQWYYMNAGDSGGRCIWTTPTGGNANKAVVAGLKRVSSKFTSDEINYDSTSNTQKFVVIITPPTGAADSHCTVP